MRKILLSLILILFLTGQAMAVTPTTVHDAVTTAAGYGTSVDLGSFGPYSGLTCFISGVAGTMNVDIDGSLDGTTYYSMLDDITALGGYTIANHFYNYYQVDVDACSGTCEITVKCQTQGGN